MAKKDYRKEAYIAVRDATKCNDNLDVSEQLGVIELVKQEIIEDALVDIKREAMNR